MEGEGAERDGGGVLPTSKPICSRGCDLRFAICDLRFAICDLRFFILI